MTDNDAATAACARGRASMKSTSLTFVKTIAPPCERRPHQSMPFSWSTTCTHLAHESVIGSAGETWLRPAAATSPVGLVGRHRGGLTVGPLQDPIGRARCSFPSPSTSERLGVPLCRRPCKWSPPHRPRGHLGRPPAGPIRWAPSPNRRLEDLAVGTVALTAERCGIPSGSNRRPAE
jgi:hypothetical protein